VPLGTANALDDLGETVPQKLPGVVFAAICFVWGSTWLAIKVGLDFLPPFLFAGARFAVAALFLMFLVPLRHAHIPRDRLSWTVMLFLGVFQTTLVYGLVFGENNTFLRD
jgi:drug/metabolite transporter (DMT)-like permease